ncbi:MAG: hypothetical protein B7Y80_06620 [Hyphomicrobium sp. 32-62-53]|nr:MAG: hypothetical protein B7Z29_04900 [Hyphomicrobium sp. 12-62-95]OYY00299.1 MAG: hypothetical protein B7Y80_06620 [Hyphomicrobium sp. 32-62-53]
MILTILIMVIATVAVAALKLAPRIGHGRVVYPTTPDKPVAFGYQMAWLAIRTRDTPAVVEALGLEAPQPCNWNSGLGTVYDPRLGQNHVFVSPPVNGWTFVVGLPLPQPMGRSFADKATPLLVDLGGRFVEVQFFIAFPPVDLFAWARMIDGRLVRAFAIGDEGIIWSKGKTTKEERALGLKLFELRGVRDRRGDAGGPLILHPTEDHVMQVARKWSLDPTKIGSNSGPEGMGLIARAPVRWRVERLKKSA